MKRVKCEKYQHENSTVRKNWKNEKRMQHVKSATRQNCNMRECNMKKAQCEKRAT